MQYSNNKQTNRFFLPGEKKAGKKFLLIMGLLLLFNLGLMNVQAQNSFPPGGNVGIGTLAPDKILTVKSPSLNTQVAKFADNARYIGIGRDEVAAFDLDGNLANLFL